MPSVGPWEIFVILIVALLVFGPKKLPEIGKSLGKGLREFKKVSRELTSSLETSYYEDEPEPPKETKSGASDSSVTSGTPPKGDSE